MPECAHPVRITGPLPVSIKREVSSKTRSSDKPFLCLSFSLLSLVSKSVILGTWPEKKIPSEIFMKFFCNISSQFGSFSRVSLEKVEPI
jgi:hypothetical protein